MARISVQLILGLHSLNLNFILFHLLSSKFHFEKWLLHYYYQLIHRIWTNRNNTACTWDSGVYDYIFFFSLRHCLWRIIIFRLVSLCIMSTSCHHRDSGCPGSTHVSLHIVRNCTKTRGMYSARIHSILLKNKKKNINIMSSQI